MLGIGGTELVIILVFGFLIFGPDRLPAMGRTIGRALRQFRQAQDQMNKMVKTEIYDPLSDAMKEPAKKQGPKKKITSSSASTKPETFAEKKARLAAEAAAKAQGASGAAAATDAESAPAVPAKKTGTSETFAEKKARLEAEKKAAEAKKESGESTGTTTAKPKTSSKKPGSSAAKLYGIDKDRIAEARAAAAAKNTGKGEQADA